MPRRRLARRFDPRGGVSDQTIETEAGYLAREIADYAVYAPNELREKLNERRSIIVRSQQELEALLGGLNELTQLAVLNLLYRDFFHMTTLYCRHVAGRTDRLSLKPVESLPTPLPYQESLFEL